MARIVKAGLIQMANKIPTERSCEEHRNAMIEAHIPYIREAAKKGVQMLCFQEIFTGPSFCPSQDSKRYGLTEDIPDGPTTKLMCELAKKHSMVIVVPIYERHMTGVYYNTAAVIDADGTYLGKYRKNHIPQVKGFWEKFFFKPGNLGYPVFNTQYGKVGVYICYDRHFPEGARALGINGAEIVFNPSATVAGLSQYLWELEQPAHAAANGYFVGAINRVGSEAPWNIGEFYGSSYFASPRGKIIAQASKDKDELLVSDLNLDEIQEIRDLWQFYRDRRPETYNDLTNL
jgi:beta-ureidopropionase